MYLFIYICNETDEIQLFSMAELQKWGTDAAPVTRLRQQLKRAQAVSRFNRRHLRDKNDTNSINELNQSIRQVTTLSNQLEALLQVYL